MHAAMWRACPVSYLKLHHSLEAGNQRAAKVARNGAWAPQSTDAAARRARGGRPALGPYPVFLSMPHQGGGGPLVPHLQQGVLPRSLTGLPVEERHLQQVSHRHLVVQHQVPARAAQQVATARGASGGAAEQAREEREASTREGQASCGLWGEGEAAAQAGHRGGRKQQQESRHGDEGVSVPSPAASDQTAYVSMESAF